MIDFLLLTDLSVMLLHNVQSRTTLLSMYYSHRIRNLAGGGGEPHTTTAQSQEQQGEIEKLNKKIEELKEQAKEDSRITMDNLTNVRNERQEDNELRTEEREAMEGGSTHQRVSIATVMLCILLRVMMVDMLQVFWSIKLA